MQRATISKCIIRFWSKFHIQILGYSFTKENRFLLTLSQSLQGKQENPCFSASRHVNNSLSVYFFLYSELNNEGMTVQVKRVFKTYFFFFFSPNNNKRADKLCIKFSSTFNTSVLRFLYPCFKMNTPIFCCFIFFEECLNPQVRINEMVNEPTIDYHPSLLLLFFEFFFKPVYPTMVAIKFQIHGVKINGKYICESNWICLLMPPSKTLPQVFIITTPGKRKLPTSPKQRFENLFFPSREGED